ncbi:MAG: hypothetical protein WCR20_06700, partial [Verrucomicrobiota bacterium]
MTTSLKISVACNLGLLAAVLCLMPASTRMAVPEPSRDSHRHPDPAPVARPFSWSQLESADYREYVANLRRIGCPEITIRDIIAADIDGIFEERRQELRRGLSATGNGLHGGNIPLVAVDQGLAALRQEQERLVAELLGGAAVAQSGARESARPRRKPPQEPEVTIPLVLQDLDLATLDIDQNRLETIQQIRDGFVVQVGGPNQDPGDPEYRQRWIRAQREADETLQAMIGLRAWQDYQFRASV